MLQKNNLGRLLAQSSSLFLLSGIGVWIMLLIRAAAQFRHSTALSYNVTFGPLTLNKLVQYKTSHGYNASISLENSFFTYLIVWLIAGLAGGYLMFLYLSRSSPR